MSSSVFSSHLSSLRLHYSSPSSSPPASFTASLPALLSACKLELARDGLIPPFSASVSSSPSFSSSACAAREFFELSCFSAIGERDLNAFNRHFAQLRAFYFDYGGVLPPSPHQSELVGLHLLSLISQSRVSEFHSELEFIAQQQRSEAADQASPLQLKRSISSSNSVLSSDSIQFPITLEQQLMEGAYNQVLNSRSQAPSPRFHYFLSLLAAEVREKVAECVAAAFDQYPMAGVHKLLKSASQDETNQFCLDHGWTVQGDTVTFKQAKQDKEKEKHENNENNGQKYGTIAQTLKFASELERIV